MSAPQHTGILIERYAQLLRYCLNYIPSLLHSPLLPCRQLKIQRRPLCHKARGRDSTAAPAACSPQTHLWRSEQLLKSSVGLPDVILGEDISYHARMRSPSHSASGSSQSVKNDGDCLSTIMVRSVNCSHHFNLHETIQVRLIGAKPIVQVKRRNETLGPVKLEVSQATTKRAIKSQPEARHGNQEPPGQAPRHGPQGKEQPTERLQIEN